MPTRLSTLQPKACTRLRKQRSARQLVIQLGAPNEPTGTVVATTKRRRSFTILLIERSTCHAAVDVRERQLTKAVTSYPRKRTRKILSLRLPSDSKVEKAVG